MSVTQASRESLRAVEVLVEARDLDTDERSVTRFEIPTPSGSDSERRELKRLVADLHPQARFRSFAGGAATFLDRQHLVVAHFAGPRPRRRASGTIVDESGQDALFAA